MNASPLRWLTEERDACGVGFLADRLGRATHKLVQQTLTALECMEHRGGCGSDGDSGDGAGIMTAIPWDLFQEWAAIAQIDLPATERMAVGMLFLPQDEARRQAVQSAVESFISTSDFSLVGWRTVPTKPEVLGVVARGNLPFICQVILDHPTLRGADLEHKLYALRRRLGKQVAQSCGAGAFYAASFSCRTLVYKG
ncbi:MAG: glutamate synthase subunit alpha, partial [Cyanobacteria bacterium J06555_12]